jgi:hypothetical protein
LPDGRVFVLGGEYSGQGDDTNTGEIYNPATNHWSAIMNFPQPFAGDLPTEVLPDGRVLAGYIFGPETYIFDPSIGPMGMWTRTGDKLHSDWSAEETWVKLPDGSILSYDIVATYSTGVGLAQRYMPATGT